ncbi:hypothetical protein A2635_05335 [Candidatus Peribacteria bacterium RIFCSPHIGHO2_01_FULL_51_9]|nr:MAG: hypothetical protein A2635_05335 [Candidatus Peribacteria bacterium RIFCSPHIGHO2_01_FULL_51_9]
MESMHISEAKDPLQWDTFLSKQQYRPFLQSWTMGEVYRDIGQPPIRLMVQEKDKILATCFGHIVPAKRGKHLSIPYGPIRSDYVHDATEIFALIVSTLKEKAQELGCSFIRVSPFIPQGMAEQQFRAFGAVDAPLHLLAEHIWHLPLTVKDYWGDPTVNPAAPRDEKEILMQMRQTTRNLIRRAEKEGVTIEASPDPIGDLPLFLKLHEETRKRHAFTPYTNAFFAAQVKHFAPRNEVTLYLAHFQGEVIAASIHMHAFGETSYHHGASAHTKVPASYLLQWRAIQDALKRGDHIYNFWGIAPLCASGSGRQTPDPKHPFAGVTLFKTGFGGKPFPLMHCMDIPLSKRYYGTRLFETLRKWRRGF